MSSSEDEDLKLAIALSMRDKDDPEVINLDSDEGEALPKASKVDIEPPPTTPTLGLVGIDRKKMEEERLARKRKRSISPPPARKAQKTDDLLMSRRQAVQPTLNPKSRAAADPGNFFSSNSPWESPLFIGGKVKKTWAFGHQRTVDDIKLEEVLQRDDLTLAVLSSFQWDVTWLLTKINTNSKDCSLNPLKKL